MSLNSKFAVLAFTTAAAACGGGSNPPPVIIDSPEEVDSPPAVVCPAPALGGLTLTGSMPFDAFINPTTPPNMGKKVFSVGALLPAEINPSGADALFIEAVTPIATNTAVAFITSSTADYQAAQGASFVFGNLTMGGADSLLWSSNGSVTFSMISETEGNMIVGAVAQTNYREVDNAGADVAGGCTSSLDQLMFTLTQGADEPPFVGGEGTPTPRGQMKQLSKGQVETAHRLIREFKAQHNIQ